MPKYKQAALAIAFLTVLLSAGVSSGLTGVKSSNENKKSQAKQESILQTFEDNDFEAWQKLVARNEEIKNMINKDQFQEFVLARQAARSGDYEKAIELSQKLENELKQKLSGFYLA